MKTKPKIGRPKKPKAEKLTATILSKVIPKERRTAIAKAKAAGMKLSAWVRKLIIEAP